MERVTGIGSIFFEARDPRALAAWYEEHLGICLGWETGALFKWEERGGTVWSRKPRTASLMISFRVTNLDRMLEQLRAGGVQIDPETEESGFGKIGWCIDPEGNRVELWEPPAAAEGRGGRPVAHAAVVGPAVSSTSRRVSSSGASICG